MCKPAWRNGRRSRLKICILTVQVRQWVFSTKLFSPRDGMVDVIALGAIFCQFESGRGHSGFAVRARLAKR